MYEFLVMHVDSSNVLNEADLVTAILDVVISYKE